MPDRVREALRLAATVLVVGTAVTTRLASAQSDATLLARAHRLMRAAPFIDTHNDLPSMICLRAACDLSRMDPDKGIPSLDTDIPRARRGAVGAQFWVAYVASQYEDKGAARIALEQIDLIRRMIDRSPSLAYAATADDIIRIHRHGRIASLIGIEGGHAIENSLATLRQFHALGVRYMTLTHGSSTAWADAATDLPKHNGLSPFGEEVVREMNRLGMMVDVSHVSDAVMSRVAQISAAPLFFSHSSVRTLANHARNVPDSIFDHVKRTNGVVMVNAYPAFVDSAGARMARDAFLVERRLRTQFPNEPARVDSAFLAYINSLPGTRLERYVDHIDYIAKRIGVAHVGIGADLGAIDTHPKGLDDISMFPNVLVELLRRGYSDRDVTAIMGGNLLRVFRRTEAVARELRRTRQPSTIRLIAPPPS
jgi:membrane dipeptidase